MEHLPDVAPVGAEDDLPNQMRNAPAPQACVLVVDPNTQVCDFLRHILRILHLEVLEAAAVDEARRHCRARRSAAMSTAPCRRIALRRRSSASHGAARNWPPKSIRCSVPVSAGRPKFVYIEHC